MNNTLTWPSVIDLADNPVPPTSDKVSKTPQEWRQQLSAEQFYVTREHGTERVCVL
jgi:peptide-methionine (R)-S-oxide reductase